MSSPTQHVWRHRTNFFRLRSLCPDGTWLDNSIRFLVGFVISCIFWRFELRYIVSEKMHLKKSWRSRIWASRSRLILHLFTSNFFQIHIQKVLETPTVIQRWTESKGQAPTVEDIERIYNKSLTATLDVLPANSHVIEGKNNFKFTE